MSSTNRLVAAAVTVGLLFLCWWALSATAPPRSVALRAEPAWNGGGELHSPDAWASAEKTSRLDVPEDEVVFRRANLAGTTFFAAVPPTGMFQWVQNDLGEQAVARVFDAVLTEERCKTGVVLDVGANTGMYSLFGAKRGCRAILFEPQPGCYRYILGAFGLNSLLSRLSLRTHPISDVPGVAVPIPVSFRCFGTNSITHETKTAAGALEPASETSLMATRTLDEVIDEEQLTEPIALIKIDTEGFEKFVLAGGLRSITAGRVDNIVVELTPKFWRSYSAADMATVLERILDAGFDAEVLPNARAADGHGPMARAEFLEYVKAAKFVQVDVWLKRRH